MDELVAAISKMKEKQALILAEKKLNQGEDPFQILDLCREAVEYIGKQFEMGNYFLPELIMAGEMLKTISKMAEPHIRQEANEAAEPIGKVIMGSVEGDIHDIGKDIVVFLLDVNGFEVHDLGVSVSADKFVETIRSVQPQIVGMSALLTTVFDSFKNTVEAITEAGLRDRVKIMIGGGTVTDDVRKYSGADAYGEDAVAAVNLSKKWVNSL
ncbi:MAG: cobalamin-dependent protein [Desulfobacterales bacterium]|jgi:5-methyltetrahydrofolate--homocysteine methyltransferase